MVKENLKLFCVKKGTTFWIKWDLLCKRVLSNNRYAIIIDFTLDTAIDGNYAHYIIYMN